MFASKSVHMAIVVGAVSLGLPTAQGLAETRAASATPVPVLTAAQIVEKHVAARGGIQAWKSVQTLQLSGKVDAGRGDSYARAMQIVNSRRKAIAKGTSAAPTTAADEVQSAEHQVQLPFTLDAKRPNKTRLEIVFAGRTAVQVYDGAAGWKLRPFLNRNDVQPFTAEEAKSEAARSDLDGPLIDYAAKGTKVSLEGVEQVEGQPAYKLKVTPKGGSEKHVWIDTGTFLDVKVDGVPRRMDGKMRNVSVYQRDFRKVDGVMIPFVLETAVDGSPDTHKMIVEKVAVNPKLDDALFAKPRA
jgi:outer membrane lipoprotein-sorting protein